MNSDKKVEKEILLKLDILVRLTGAMLTEGKSGTEQIKLLAQSGLRPKDIAGITGKTANNVRVTLNYIRSLKKKKKKKSKP